MDYHYYNKYLKYKTKYLELKNINSLDQTGGGKKIMFIMFPGYGVSKKGWDCYFEKDKKIKTNFISELKKIGSIYFHEPLYHNINYYHHKENKHSKYLYDKNIDFTRENFDIVKECDKIYQKIKDFKGMFVLIGHSIGSYFVYCFEQKYSSRCLFSVIIDGANIGPVAQTLNDNKYLYPKIEKYQKCSDQLINELKEKVRENDEKSINKLFNIAIYNLFSYKKVTINARPFKKPLIGFYNIRIGDDNDKKKLKMDHFFNVNRMSEIDYLMKHNHYYRAITFINKHIIHIM